MTTIIVLNGSDRITDDRSVINSNFAALNAGKPEVAGFVDNEIVSGSGTSWTLTNTPVSGSVHLYGEGQFLTPGAGNDYTISGTSITTVNSFPANSLVANYRK